jgi:carbonic anhydrase
MASPIDIITSQVIHKCMLRCSFQYDFGTSSCVITNSGTFLHFKYDEGVSTVLFNDDAYVVSDVRLYSKGIHLINNTRGAAELVIHLTGRDVMTNNLQICIPFQENDAVSPTETMMEQIVQVIGALNQPVSVNVVPSFSLNAMTPKSGYYFYQGNSVYGQDGGYNIIVFNQFPNISRNTLGKLRLNIAQHSITTNTFDKNRVYYNKIGTSAGGFDGSDDIYIDCQPTDDSPDIMAPDEAIEESIADNQRDEKIWRIVLVIISILVILAVFVATYYAMKILNPKLRELSTQLARKT